jgi:hypothetical protein
MIKINRSTLAFGLVALFALPFGVACDRHEGPAEELGESIDDAVDDLKDSGEDLGDKLEDAADEIKDGAEDIKDDIDGDGGNG